MATPDTSTRLTLRPAAGVVFSHVKPKMAAMWHTHAIDGCIEPILETLRTTYSGPATLWQDLTVFNVTPRAVEARQVEVSPVEQPVVGPSENEFVLDKPLPSPN